MMTLDKVAAFAGQLAGVTVGTKWGRRTWMISDRGFVWERPLGKADLARFGDATPPAGDIIGVIVENLDAKDALLAIGLSGFFTIQHFNGFPAILIALRDARAADVHNVIKAAWRIATTRGPSRKPTATPKRAVAAALPPPRKTKSKPRGR